MAFPLAIPLVVGAVGFGAGIFASNGLNKIITGAMLLGATYYVVK